MPKQRDRAWRRRQRALHIRSRVEDDRIPTSPEAWPTAVWQLHTPDGVPMPFFKRRASGPHQTDPVGKEIVVAVRHEHGCPLFRPTPWFNHVTRAWVRPDYTPTLTGCGPGCVPFPGPPGKKGWGYEVWPAAPLGFVWRLVRHTNPQRREPTPGKLAKWRCPKGGTGRHSGIFNVKNWKLLYTRHVKVKRAQQLGFEYGCARRGETDE